MIPPVEGISPSGHPSFARDLEWGTVGLRAAPGGAVVVVVDVLRFSTAVEAASGRGAAVYPHAWRDDSLVVRAGRLDARIADGSGALSLSPLSLLDLSPGERVLLPSPNGAACALVAAGLGAAVVAACLRNASAVAAYLAGLDRDVAVIACGERWRDGSLRPAVEDLLGAGAVLSALGGRLSPEASAAVAAFHEARDGLEDALIRCVSGRQLLASGRRADVSYAAQLDASTVVPVLDGDRFCALAAP